MIIREESRISHWKHLTTGKHCKVCSTFIGRGNWQFKITGHNPLPCKSFMGSFIVLAQWLLSNGWVHDTTKADIVIINTTIK